MFQEEGQCVRATEEQYHHNGPALIFIHFLPSLLVNQEHNALPSYNGYNRLFFM